MESNSQLPAKKYILNSFLFLISLFSALFLMEQVNLLIFGIDPPDPDTPLPIGLFMPVTFIYSFLIIFLPVYSILTFIKTGYQFANNKILNNENRKKIVNQIFRYPGIHHNELLRTTELQPGQLQWHLNKLMQNRIVRKDKIEHFAVYFPSNMTIPVNSDYFFLKKSKVTLTILNHIKQNSGIYQSKIGHELNLKRNTVKYHIDKLLQKKFIFSAQIGRKKFLYPTPSSEVKK